MQIIIVIIAVIVILLILYYVFRSRYPSTKVYVVSSFDQKKYLVQNLPGKEQAAYLLSVINSRINKLKQYLADNMSSYDKYRPYIQQLLNHTHHLVLTENAPGGQYTSYTVNKGDEITLCLRSKETGNFHDINLLMFVTLHEISHIACPEVNHTKLWQQIFDFFIQVSDKIDIYQPVDFKTDPHRYCGMTINS